MTERVIARLDEPETLEPTPEDITAGVAQAEVFLRDVAPHLGRLFGMDLQISIGKKWATELRPGSNNVTADPRFFIEKGYTPDMTNYATLHEVAAHLKVKANDPRHMDRVLQFLKRPDEGTGDPKEREVDPKKMIFYNIFSDIAGNNLIHATLPRMKSVAKDLYQQKLFRDDVAPAETDQKDQDSPEAIDRKPYIDAPRHLQFLYKIIRQEMIPGSETTVLPEVDEAIDGLRNFEGHGDLITYSTAVAKSSKVAMTDDERFSIWVRAIYPVYEKLLVQDRQDPDRQDQPSDGSGDGDGDGTPSDGQEGTPSDKPGNDKKTDKERFGSYYDDYNENRHPEPMSKEEQDKLHDHAKAKNRAKRLKPQTPEAIRREQERLLDTAVRAETGHSLREQQAYNAEITRWRSSIDEMRSVFQTVLSERIAQRRRLSRRSFPEGVVLDADRLVQTVIDVRNNVDQPEAFREYEKSRGDVETFGKTDYVFLFDVSASMAKEYDGVQASQSAASAGIIGLEGLAAMQRDIEAAEAENDMSLELDIRTAIYVFGQGARCLKPLSTKVSAKERLDAYAAISNPRDGDTQDYEALHEISALDIDTSRRRIVIAVTDGESADSQKASEAIHRLRSQGWLVYGISIGSDAAERLYQPTAKKINDPAELPETIEKFIEDTIS